MPSPLGDRVRELRRKKGLTLEALAERVGSSKSYMWEIENKDVARPSAEKLHLIAIALDTTTDYLIIADDVTEADATDKAFFRKYRKMDTKDKEKLREMLKILDTDDQ
ncbi:MAG: helix-turn-helix domain-containing protein [Reyranella sp.]|nr:helix-turn-helix domain-containing protein [Reyranella sp.]